MRYIGLIILFCLASTLAQEAQLVRMEAVQWSDSCLGAPRPEEFCLQSFVSGFRLELVVNGDLWVLHTDAQGENSRRASVTTGFVPPLAPPVTAPPVTAPPVTAPPVTAPPVTLPLSAPPSTPTAPLTAPLTAPPVSPVVPAPPQMASPLWSPVALRAREVLARELEVPLESITVVAVESVTWPNPCLALPEPDEVCAPALTEGYRVVLFAAGEYYVFRTDASAATVRRSLQ